MMTAVPSTAMASRSSPKAVARAKLDVPRERLTRLGILGAGSFGLVTLEQDSQTGSMYALKAMSKGYCVQQGITEMVLLEKKIHSMMDSLFIVPLYTTYHDDQFVYFLLEPLLGGELFWAYHDHDEWFRSAEHARFFSAGVALGLDHMHAKKVVYRDLKLENILLNGTGYPLLTDFGLAKVVFGKTYTVCGTADYFAPEVLRQTGHNRAVDWWASGVLLFIMVAGRSPFDAPEVSQIYKNIVKGFSKVKFPKSFPSDLTDTIKSLCRKQPEERVTMQKGGVENLKEMPFFLPIRWSELVFRTSPAPYVPPALDLDAIRDRTLSRPVDIDFDSIEMWDGAVGTAIA